MCEEWVYRVEARDGKVECPRCHTIINAEDFEGYELIDIDGSCCGDIFNVTIRCMKCGVILEIT
jgi:phage FluMu protein Com